MFNNTRDPRKVSSWATTDELKARHPFSQSVLYLVMVWKWNALPFSSGRCLNSFSPGGGAILEGSRTFGKMWVTKARSSGFVAQELFLCSLSASRSLQLQTGIARYFTFSHDPPHSHTVNQNTLIFFKWLCLISHHHSRKKSSNSASQTAQVSKTAPTIQLPYFQLSAWSDQLTPDSGPTLHNKTPLLK